MINKLINNYKKAHKELVDYMSSIKTGTEESMIISTNYPFALSLDEYNLDNWGIQDTDLIITVEQLLDLSADDMEYLHQFRQDKIRHERGECCCNREQCLYSKLAESTNLDIRTILHTYYNWSE